MEAKIINKSDLEEFQLLKTKYFDIGFYAQRNPHKNSPNEDALGVFTHGKQTVLAVADGVGGNPNGDEASSTTITKIIEAFKKSDTPPKDLSQSQQLLIKAIEDSNQALIHNFVGAQTTLSACIISDNLLQSIQIGDSSVLVCGQKGLLKYKSLEHSPTGLLIEAGTLSEEEALSHPERHIVTNVVGDTDMHIDIGPKIELAPYDTILIASDGIFDNFTSPQLIELIRKDSLEEVVTRLTALIQPMRDQEKESEFIKIDDVSFIICRQHTSA